VSAGLYSGVSGLALGTGLYKNVSGLWGGASGLINGFGGGSPFSGASLYLNFLAGAPLDSRVTFSRGSNATLVDSTGKITYAPANLLPWSEDFSNAVWGKSATTVTANTTVAPDGTSTADTVTETVANNFHAVSAGFTFVAGVSYTISIFAKQGSGTRVLQLYPSFAQGGNSGSAFNLVNGTVVTTAGTGSGVGAITNAGNGWYRCSHTFVCQTSGANTIFYGLAQTTANAMNFVYTGDGTSSLSLWGAQTEQVTYQTTPSTYVATTSAAYYGPRFDYDPVTLAAKGLLIEEQRTNLLLYSSDFTNASWTKSLSAMAGTFTTAPDGTNTGAKWREDGTLAEHQIYATPSLTAASHTETWYLKAAERTKVRVSLATAGLAYGASVIADLSAGTLSAVTNLGIHTGATATISAAGNGWYRVSLTITATATTYYPALTLVTGTNTTNYLGDGTSGIFIWGAQVEAGAFATSYIPTVASTVTRSADVATMTGTNFSSWYNASAGTMLCNFALEGQTAGGAVSDVWVVNNSGSTANATRLREGTIIAGADVTMLTGGAVQVDSNSFATPVNTTMRSAFAWSSASSNLTANGISLGDGGAITPPTVNQLVLTGGNKWLQQVAFYNTRLTNAQLQTLTAPSLTTTLSMSFTDQAYTVGV